MRKNGFAPVAVLVLLFMVAGLGLAVTRVTDLKNVFQKPKATETTVQYPTDGFYQATREQTNSVSDVFTTVSFNISNNGTKISNIHLLLERDCDGKRMEQNNIPDQNLSNQAYCSVFSPVCTSPVFLNFPGTTCSSFFTIGMIDPFQQGKVGLTGVLCAEDFGCGHNYGYYGADPALQQPAGKSCAVSLSASSITTGQSVTVTSSGTGGTVKTTISRTDTSSISGLGNPFFTDNNNQGHKYYDITGRSSLSGLSEGTYKVFCHIADEPNKCSGNPFCSNLPAVECAGWGDCGSADNADLTVVKNTGGAMSCSVSGPTTATTGSPANYTISAVSGASRTELWYISTSAKDNQGSLKQFLGSVSFLNADNYYVFCNTHNDSTGTKCSGNPFLPLPEGWTSCGDNSKMQVTVTAGSSGGPACGSVTIIEAD